MLQIVMFAGPRFAAAGRRVLSAPLVWCLIAVGLIAGRDLAADPTRLLRSLGDTDDATRLVQVRTLLDGAWFDTTLGALGAPEPLLSHWSRLIDLPLALIIRMVEPFAGLEGGELAARVVWPLALLLAGLAVVTHEAARRTSTAGQRQTALLVALALAATSTTALGQFMPGRIDHHNAQIVAATFGLLMLVRALDEPDLGWAAGGALGLGAAVGYEALPLSAAAIVLTALIGLWQPPRMRGVVHAVCAMAGVLAVSFLATIPPERWADVRCDALSANLPVLVLMASAGLCLADRAGRGHRRIIAAAVAALAGLLALAAYTAMEPRCLAGPFGQTDPRIMPIWIAHVLEGLSLASYAAQEPAAAASFLTMMLLAAAAELSIWREERSTSGLARLAILIMATLYALVFVKLMAYAAWLALPSLAAGIARLAPRLGQTARTVRLAATVLASQTTLAGLIALPATAVEALLPASGREVSGPPAPLLAKCRERAAVERLGALPPGLVLADLDLGPDLAALTRHRVVAAPYHRLDRSIIARHEIMWGSASAAEAPLRGLSVTYVVACRAPGIIAEGDPSFAASLKRGAAPPFLVPVTLPGGRPPFDIWRLTPR